MIKHVIFGLQSGLAAIGATCAAILIAILFTGSPIDAAFPMSPLGALFVSIFIYYIVAGYLYSKGYKNVALDLVYLVPIVFIAEATLANGVSYTLSTVNSLGHAIANVVIVIFAYLFLATDNYRTILFMVSVFFGCIIIFMFNGTVRSLTTLSWSGLIIFTIALIASFVLFQYVNQVVLTKKETSKF